MNEDQNNNLDNTNVKIESNPVGMESPTNSQDTTQNDYYNNDSFYNNNNYNSSNYSDTTYEEPEKKKGLWWKVLLAILLLLIVIIVILKFAGSGKTDDEKYNELSNTLCTAAKSYVADNEGLIDTTKPGTSVTIKLQKLSDANLIEPKILNPYYSNSLFKKSNDEKYYSMDNSVRLTVLNDASLNCEMVDNSTDITAPELRLSGDAEVSIVVGTEFEDPGFTATDDYDGDISSNVVRSGNVDITKTGEYVITYSVSDSAGNVTTKTRKIIVYEYKDIDFSLNPIYDKITPNISLKGANPYCLVKGEKYVEPGAIATDNIDGDITNRITVTNKVTGNLLGTFRVAYKVSDTYGNEAAAYRAVVVRTECPANANQDLIANTPPVINVLGQIAITIKKGEAYVDKGAEASDKEDGDITNRIITDVSDVNVNATGVYKVVYKVTDSAGASTTAVRTVTVKDSIISGTPSVRWTNSKTGFTVVVGRGSDSMIAAPKAVDENNVAVNVTTSIEDKNTNVAVSSIDWNTVGKYGITYTAIHGSGSVRQTSSIVVNVIADTVTIGGKDTIDVTKRSASCDITEADINAGGVTFTTIENATAIVSVYATSGIACKVGTYDVNISARTNTSLTATKKITVNVVEGSGTINTGAPSKVVITSNSAFPTDVYNDNLKWVGGTVLSVETGFSSTPATGTEIAYFEWTEDCASDTATGQITKDGASSGTYQWKKEGASNICIRAVSTAGIKGAWSNPLHVNIDKIGPTISFTHTWADDAQDWHNTPSLVVTYSASDPSSQSGLDHFEYTYDDVKGLYGPAVTNPNTMTDVTGSLTVYEGTELAKSILYVYVRAVDRAGNIGEWTSNPAFLNIDTIKPDTPTLSVVDNSTSVVKISATFNDGISLRPSGFGKMIYTVNGGEELTETSWNNDTKASTIVAPSNNTNENVTQEVKVWAVDKAGNTSNGYATTSIVVAPAKISATGIDLKNGTTAIEDGTACSTSTLYVGSTMTLTATPIPTNSDDKVVTWSSNNANVAVVNETGVVTVNNVGTASITAKIGTITKTCTISSQAQVVNTDSGESSSGGSTSSCNCQYCTQSACVIGTHTNCTKSGDCWSGTVSEPVSDTNDHSTKYRCSTSGAVYSTSQACSAYCTPCPTKNGVRSCKCSAV